MKSFLQKFVRLCFNLNFIEVFLLSAVLSFSLILTRVTFKNQFSYVFGQYSDFTTASFLPSDIFLVLLLIFLFYKIVVFYKYGLNKSFYGIKRLLLHVTHETLLYSVLWTWVFLDIVFRLAWLPSGEILSALFFSVPLLVMLSIVLLCKFLARPTKTLFLYFALFITFLGILEVLVAFLQFWEQESLSLPFHMEPNIAPFVPNVATIPVGRLLFLRSYGTFAHPNILAGFLFLLIIFFFYFYISQKEAIVNYLSRSFLSHNITKNKFMAYIRLNIDKVFNLLCIFVISWLILGLYISFSRTALVALVFSLSVIIFGYFWLNSGQKQQKKPLLALSIYSIGWVVVLGLLFWPITQARQPHLKEAAIAERANYNSIGLAMFKDHFWFGVGLNQSIVHMQEYSKVPLKPWEHQPVHNYFILLAAELGVFPLIVLLAFLLQVFWLVFKKAVKRNLSILELLTFAFLCGLLGLMNGDHYFYTLRVGQIFFWLSMAVVGGVFFAPTPPSLPLEMGGTREDFPNI